MSDSNCLIQIYVLKLLGHQGLTFKAKHRCPTYLENVAEHLLNLNNSNFIEYDIYASDQSNLEMTQNY
ncbi:MAG: hypothetical protein U9R28_00620 [Pseudomonadota bacterium]|nr:hypothetical protein [Pseudomonadota bacterium]